MSSDRPGPNPDPADALVLVPPEPAARVAERSATDAVQLDPDTAAKLDEVTSAFADELASLDPRSRAFEAKAGSVHTLGSADIRQAAEVSNRLLNLPVRAMEKGGLADSGPVAKSLTDLRKTVEELDPARFELFSPKRLLGIIPFGSKVRDYFRRYQSAQSHLNGIIESLNSGQAVLRRDVASVEEEKATLWAVMQRLRQYVYMVDKLDEALSAKIAALTATDPDRARSLNEDVLFYVRQKKQDLLTQLAVSVQGYLALDVVRKNDLELIKGVDRATTTTVSALRTAVIVAQALANEKLVLDQINALNTTTGNLIESTSELLRKQTGEVYAQSAGATLDVEKLRAAFRNIYSAIDSIDAYKQQALASLRETSLALGAEVARAQERLDRAATGSEALPEGSGEGVQLRLPEAKSTSS